MTVLTERQLVRGGSLAGLAALLDGSDKVRIETEARMRQMIESYEQPWRCCGSNDCDADCCPHMAYGYRCPFRWEARDDGALTYSRLPFRVCDDGWPNLLDEAVGLAHVLVDLDRLDTNGLTLAALNSTDTQRSEAAGLLLAQREASS